MLRKVLFVMVIAAMLMVGVVAAQDEGEPLVIGVLTDQTSALQLYGFEMEQGFRIGLDYATGGSMEVGGRPIEVVVLDNGSDPDVAAQHARELIEVEGAEVLFGTVSSGVTLGLKQIAVQNDVILMMGPSAAGILTQATNEDEQELLDNSFRACRSSTQDAFAFGAWALDNVGEDYVIFAADYAFGQATAAGYEAAFGALGGNITSTIYAPLDTTDFQPYAQEILDSDADGFVLIWAGAGIATLYQQFEELGVFDELPAVAPFSSVADLLASQPAEGSVGVAIYHPSLPDTEANDFLIEQHMERYGSMPDLFSECGFSSAQAIVASIENAIENGADPLDATLPEFMAPELEGLEWEGVKGTYTMRAGDHQTLLPMYVVELTELNQEEGTVTFELIDEVLPDEYELPCISLDCPAPEESE